jgi:hypothetical protein
MLRELTAEQKIRQQLTCNPLDDPHWQHAGESIVRWITGGSQPDLQVTFHREGDQITVKCATCKNILGYLPANHDADQTAQALQEMRQSGFLHH